MQIGMEQMGGDPEAFYLLSRERQIDVLAMIQVKTEPPPKLIRKVKVPVEGTEKAKQFWSFAFGGGSE